MEASSSAVVTPAAAKRKRDPLGVTSHQARYLAASQHKECYLGSRAVAVTAEKSVRAHYHAKTAIAASRQMEDEMDWNSLFTDNEHSSSRYAGSASDRRICIKYLYLSVFGAPPKAKWHDMNLVSVISHLLDIPKNSHTAVHDTLIKIHEKVEEYDGSVEMGQGRKAMIEDGTEQAKIVYRTIAAGCSAKDAACLLNVYRSQLPEPLEPLSRRAVQGFIERSDSIKVRKRGVKKSGKDDQESTWAKARSAQAAQWHEQLRLGTLPVNHPDVLASPFSPIYTDGIVFWDEHHREVILGEAGAYQYMIATNEKGVVTAPSEGGKFGPEKDITSIKYPGEGRGVFGVAVVVRGGVKQGVRATPFDYTGRKVISEKAFQVAMKIEVDRVLPLKGCWGEAGKGYKERFGDSWEDELRKEVNKKLCSIHDIIDHVISESRRVYQHTLHAEDFRIFHDGLTVWWTPEAQAYIESKGFKDRQLRCEGDTNKGTRYENKVVGDSPEMCRGLDAYGFSDFKRCTERMRALTSVYDWMDPRRFKFGTPKEVWNTMARCWTIEPTSERIIADIEDFSNVLGTIISHNGCVVPECRLRHGHRQQAHNGGRVLMRKVTQRQRKQLMTMGPVHSDAEEALQILLGTAIPEEAEEIPMDQVILAAEEANVELGEGENDPDGDDDPEGENSDWEAEF